MSSQRVESVEINTKKSQPIPASAGRIVLLAAISLLSGLGVADWYNNSSVGHFTGYLKAQTETILARRAGRIQEISVQTGQVVSAGEVVMVLADGDLQNELDLKNQKISSLSATLKQAQARAEVELAWRTKSLDTEVFNTQMQLAHYLKGQLTENIANLAWQEYIKNYNSLTSSDSSENIFKSLIYDSRLPDEERITAMLRQEASRNAAEVFSAQVHICEKRLKDLEQLKSSLPEKIRRAEGVDVAESQLEIAQAELKQLEQQREKLTVCAVSYGTVGVFRKQVGDRTEAGEVIVELFDRDQLFLEVDIPSRKLSSFPEGADVELSFPNGLKRTGRVTGVPPEAIVRRQSAGFASAADSYITLAIERTGKIWPEVPIGAAVNVVHAESSQ